MKQCFSGNFAGKTVFVTGHTGFKGSWLTLWLTMLGARVVGYSLEPDTKPALFNELKIRDQICHITGDVRDPSALQKAMTEHQPQIVFHLAAQPLVRLSYDQPAATFATNIMGTVNVLESIRQVSSVRACVCVTSDKCYENNEWAYAYRENDPMGGHDPYSASKGCAELVTSSYRRSFFAAAKHAEHGVAIASARAGNVIGGGDWALDRIFPDSIRALADNKAVPMRNPGAVRPWQHVIEPLSGYLLLASRLLSEGPKFASAWNFGPVSPAAVPVKNMVEKIVDVWGHGSYDDLSSLQKNAPHEANYLRLDCSKAVSQLGWQPLLTVDEAIRTAAEWYREFYLSRDFSAMTFTGKQITDYASLARSRGMSWAS